LLLFLLGTYATVAVLPFAPKKFGDLNFHEEAKTLSLAVRGRVSWRDVEITRAPAPVFYYAVPYLFVSEGSDDNTYWRAAFLWTAVCTALSLLLVRRCGEILGGSEVGKAAGLLTVLSPFSVYYSYGILAEPPAYLGVVLLSYGFLRWKNSPGDLSHSRWNIFLLATGLLIFVLSRPNAVVLLLIAIIVGSMLCRRQGIPRAEGKFVLVSALSTAIIIAAMTGFLLQRSGGSSANPQNQNLATVVLQGRFQFRSVYWDFRTWPDLPDNPDFQEFQQKIADFQHASVQDRVVLSKIEWRWIAQDFIHHPGITARSAGIKLICLHFAFVHSLEPAKFHVVFLKGRFGYAVFHVLVNLCTMVLVAGSFLFLLDHRHGLLDYWVLWGPWLSLTLFHMLTYAEARYLFPGRPGLVLMASAALVPRIKAIFCMRARLQLVKDPASALVESGLSR
jgi:hypothetical protein